MTNDMTVNGVPVHSFSKMEDGRYHVIYDFGSEAEQAGFHVSDIVTLSYCGSALPGMIGQISVRSANNKQGIK